MQKIQGHFDDAGIVSVDRKLKAEFAAHLQHARVLAQNHAVDPLQAIRLSIVDQMPQQCPAEASGRLC